MSVLEIVCGFVLNICSVILGLVVLFQEGKQQGLGAITGNASDTFIAKNKSRSIDAFLERWTRFLAIGFFVLVIFINTLSFFKVI